ncbi:MAG TPA: hypothetical protein VHV08_14825 [Pirellulales bacterium]|nr:hypothetical protein [Pirellulales bacterium]
MEFVPLISEAEKVKYLQLAEDIRRKNNVTHRNCGECTLCCTILAVPELRKASGTGCLHCTNGGCQIYELRPNSCRCWSCDWLLGWQGLTDAQRPDKLGLMFARDDAAGPLVAYETSPGSSKTKKARKVLERLASKRKVFLNPFGTINQRVPVNPPQQSVSPPDSLADDLPGLGGQLGDGPPSRFR